ncbi:MAG: SpaH/EbpB family LPXTG-anchored major pilin [Clostridiales bacterium]|nr:SpaH/EbpB family LPXTG-anchored major pilin [Clostridiales bacterium]
MIFRADNKKEKYSYRKEQKNMTRTFKKLISVVITVVMVMMLGVTSMAAPDLTITIDKATGDTANHTYEVYQIFSGDKTETTPGSGNYELTNINWGAGVNGPSLLSYLKANVTGFEDCTSAADVAGVLESFSAERFAKIVSDYLTDYSDAVENTSAARVTLDVSADGFGYYIITDQVIPVNGTTVDDPAGNGAVSQYMLKVVNIHTDTGAINAKSELPTLDKKIILDDNSEVEANVASVGDTVHFQLKSEVPDLSTSGYNRYWYIMNDTLSKGLAFQAGSVEITVNGAPFTGEFELTPSASTDGTAATNIEIVFKNFLSIATEDLEIIVTYDAVLTKDCDMTTAGNPNTANLIYSNDPTKTYDGDKPSNPGPDTPIGKTPDVMTKTYTTGIVVIKVDGEGHRLTGAEFQIELSGTNANTVVVEGQEFVKDNTNGTYYKLKNGSYTLTPPSSATDPDYESTTDKYRLDSVSRIDKTVSEHKATGTVDDQGYLAFQGLGEGTYKIKETSAPRGYVPSSVEHTVVITSTNPSLTSPNWTYTVDGAAATTVELTFVNVKSSNLPSTGGMGTTVFYIAGSVLLAAGVALLIAKKVKTKEN